MWTARILPLVAAGLALSMTVVLEAAGSSTVAETLVPSRFEANRVYVRLQTLSGKTLTLYTDTGGGGLVLSRMAASRLGLRLLAPDPDLIKEIGPDTAIADAPVLSFGNPPLPPRAIIMPKARQVPDWPDQADGFLGAPWFADGIWTWDYLRQRLVKEAKNWSPPPEAHVLPLYFKVEPDGTRTTNFARLTVRVAGQDFPMLLDTGAETYLTQEARDSVGGPALQATSMVAASLFDRWRQAHPDWRYVAKAQVSTNAAMIQAHDVEIAGLSLGQVWFTRRSDENFHQFMSPMMDRQVEGSIGGNALQSLVMTIDYPKARGAFQFGWRQGSAANLPNAACGIQHRC